MAGNSYESEKHVASLHFITSLVSKSKQKLVCTVIYVLVGSKIPRLHG